MCRRRLGLIAQGHYAHTAGWGCSEGDEMKFEDEKVAFAVAERELRKEGVIE